MERSRIVADVRLYHVTQILKSDNISSPTASLQNLNYVYDAVGNIRTITDSLASETQSFKYDVLDRLITATIGDVTSLEKVSYDPATGNLLGKASTTSAPPAPNPGTTGLAAWWSMDENNGPRHDSHGTNDLTDNNTVASAGGLKGTAASFTTGNYESLTVADNPSISGGDIDFTWVVNVYLNNTSGNFLILDKSDNASVYDYRLSYNSGTGFRFRVGSGSAYVDSGVVTANAWHTVFAWHDAANNKIKIQVDTGAEHVLDYSLGTRDSAYPLSIGAYPNGSSEMDGRLDEVALYRRVLTPEERTWLYNSGLGRNYAGVSNALAYGYTDPNHRHAVTSFAGNTYAYDANGNMTQRVIGADTYLLSYDAENRLVEVKKNSTSIASFVYDGDGKRVKSILNQVTTTFVSNYYEMTGSIVTKYYYAGATRIATLAPNASAGVRVNGTLSYILSDHLGSTSFTTDANGAKISELRYSAWGEVRLPTNDQIQAMVWNRLD